MAACESFFESWFGPPIGQPEHMERVLERRKNTKKDFSETLYRFVNLWIGNWKPISDAPKDKPILCYTQQGNIYVGQWCKNPYDDDEAFYIYEQNGEKFIIYPTHFMELPDAP